MNYTKRYLDGYLSDEPLSRYEKLNADGLRRVHRDDPMRSPRKRPNGNDKERTIARKRARAERLRVVDGWEYQKIQE